MKKFPKYDEVFISPSVLSADFSCLKKEIKSIEKYSGWIQLDVMDGHFVPNLSFGPHIASCIKKISNLPLDVHLMVEKPLLFIEPFVKSGADLITVHYESKDFESALRLIKRFNKKVGIAIKPKTSFEKIKKYIKFCDLILVMTVEPGFGGQSFMFDMLDKIKKAKDFITVNRLKKYIQVDGGVNENTMFYAINCGANSLVMGSAVFGKKNPDNIKRLWRLINAA